MKRYTLLLKPEITRLMKNLMLMLCLCICWCCQGQNERTTKKMLQFEQSSSENTLIVENLNGNITVEGYDGQKVELELVTRIDAKSKSLIEKGFSEVKLGLIEKEDLIILYMDNPCTSDKKTWSKDKLLSGQSFNWTNNCEWQPKYDFNLNFKLRVPRNTNVKVMTVNEGEIELKGINGAVTANNINGGIQLESIVSATKAHTINGDVEVTYKKNPNGECDFYTLNGDINVSYQPGLSANVELETQHGDFYTDIDEVEVLPVQVTETKKEKGIKYKIGGGSNLKIRNGGPQFKFKTFNGNIILKEKQGS